MNLNEAQTNLNILYCTDIFGILLSEFFVLEEFLLHVLETYKKIHSL